MEAVNASIRTYGYPALFGGMVILVWFSAKRRSASAEGLGRAPDERDRPGGVERGGSGYNRATLLDHAFPASARWNWSRWLSSCQSMSVTKSSTVRRPRR